jgi:glycosyltransferase involved in cell wall biosynthesis
MAAARPLVATTAGGTPELVRADTDGLLVPPGEPAPLARSILALFSDPQRAATLALSARRRVESDLTIDRLVERTERVYDRMTEEHADRAATR